MGRGTAQSAEGALRPGMRGAEGAWCRGCVVQRVRGAVGPWCRGCVVQRCVVQRCVVPGSHVGLWETMTLWVKITVVMRHLPPRNCHGLHDRAAWRFPAGVRQACVALGAS